MYIDVIKNFSIGTFGGIFLGGIAAKGIDTLCRKIAEENFHMRLTRITLSGIKYIPYLGGSAENWIENRITDTCTSHYAVKTIFYLTLAGACLGLACSAYNCYSAKQKEVNSN